MAREESSSGSNSLFIQIQKALKGVDYPTDKQTLVETARSNGASEDVLSALGALPDQQFQTPAEVSKAVGEEET
ncbi:MULTISPECIES: DUF2795 domain-containing protein [unclassified Caballeronia]|uniref:DUF2795 domain-containing protein n=1 Tax=unclassified Caballeronia TaxID=2646786 RepID=UPI0028648978|nr:MULTISPECIES: DUF2795 domain-containing protein [unclassified Caballeronia]MDR5755004.1 DUF2795 domain-containing protein [Caballeronia sp. LZ024]MDR5845566.1 DUF2795 domain-containing protein [Caballeronia sp. LZ031]